MQSGYFHRVTRETPTRLWINNPTEEEMELALEAGAISCTTNPAYCSKLIRSEPAYIHDLIDQAIRETSDDTVAADRVYQDASARIMARFLPRYEQSGGTEGFVTIQSDPRRDEETDALVEAALRYRVLGPNFMTKIPVTRAGLEAMAILLAEDMPLCMTEVFSIDQTRAACELYQRVSQKTGKHPPFYITHITGIFDEYMNQVVQREGIPISPDVLGWAGSSVGRKEYRLLQERGWPGVFLGGGARTTKHFTDFVGGHIHITINWSTAQQLIERDPPTESRIDIETPAPIVRELTDKLEDFRRAYNEGALRVETFAEYGPVQHFRNNFIAGYEHLVNEIATRRNLVPAA